MPDVVTAAVTRDRALLDLVLDYHAFNISRPLLRATREEWIARFRDVVGTGGHEFEGRPPGDHVIRLWRGTRREADKNGLSWTSDRAMAETFARGGGRLWRIDSVPLAAILYYDPTHSSGYSVRLLSDGDIPNPWRGSATTYVRTHRLIERACRDLFTAIRPRLTEARHV